MSPAQSAYLAALKQFQSAQPFDVKGWSKKLVELFKIHKENLLEYVYLDEHGKPLAPEINDAVLSAFKIITNSESTYPQVDFTFAMREFKLEFIIKFIAKSHQFKINSMGSDIEQNSTTANMKQILATALTFFGLDEKTATKLKKACAENSLGLDVGTDPDFTQALVEQTIQTLRQAQKIYFDTQFRGNENCHKYKTLVALEHEFQRLLKTPPAIAANSSAYSDAKDTKTAVAVKTAATNTKDIKTTSPMTATTSDVKDAKTTAITDGDLHIKTYIQMIERTWGSKLPSNCKQVLDTLKDLTATVKIALQPTARYHPTQTQMASPKDQKQTSCGSDYVAAMKRVNASGSNYRVIWPKELAALFRVYKTELSQYMYTDVDGTAWGYAQQYDAAESAIVKAFELLTESIELDLTFAMKKYGMDFMVEFLAKIKTIPTNDINFIKKIIANTITSTDLDLQTGTLFKTTFNKYIPDLELNTDVELIILMASQSATKLNLLLNEYPDNHPIKNALNPLKASFEDLVRICKGNSVQLNDCLRKISDDLNKVKTALPDKRSYILSSHLLMLQRAWSPMLGPLQKAEANGKPTSGAAAHFVLANLEKNSVAFSGRYSRPSSGAVEPTSNAFNITLTSPAGVTTAAVQSATTVPAVSNGVAAVAALAPIPRRSIKSIVQALEKKPGI